jgi:hypothetical protein
MTDKEREQQRREARLFKMNNRGSVKIHRNSFRKIRAVFVELTKDNKRAA